MLVRAAICAQDKAAQHTHLTHVHIASKQTSDCPHPEQVDGEVADAFGQGNVGTKLDVLPL